MSDYDWFCPSCGNRVHWSDDHEYSDELDDTVCVECGGGDG
jgi:hypothetical protein